MKTKGNDKTSVAQTAGYAVYGSSIVARTGCSVPLCLRGSNPLEQGGPTVTKSCLKPLRLFGRSPMRSRSVVAPAQGLELFQSARPVLLEQARKRAVRQELAARLADGAVIGLVIGVADALHLGAAARARLAVAALMPGLSFPSPAGSDPDKVSCAGPG